jgi:hypothetical protein
MITLDANGVSIDTFDVILAEVQDEFRSKVAINIATDLKSSAGQIQHAMATREEQQQQAVLRLYQNQDARSAEGVHQDQRNSLLGVTRQADTPAEVLGTATGTPATNLPNGSRLSVGGFVFQIADGPYTIGGGGTVTGVKLVAELPGALDVTLLGAWTIVDVISGFTSFADTSQPVVGRLVETDAEYRAAAEVERFSRAAGSLLAIEAAVALVTGVTSVNAVHNVTTDPVDANGIPLYQINVIVEGGLDADVAQAIFDSGPAGHTYYGTTTVVVGSGPASETIRFDRVTTITMWTTITLTTSTSEDDAPADLLTLVPTMLVDYTAGVAGAAAATAAWQIGTDVLAKDLRGALAGIAGVDEIVATMSTDDGALDPYATTKRPMTIRERAVLITSRVIVVED